MTGVPTVITSYFSPAQSRDADRLTDLFTEDAWVFDEGERYEGKPRIRDWRETKAAAYTYELKVRGASETATGVYAVRTHLEGGFPGGMADLTHEFTLRDGLIASLHI